MTSRKSRDTNVGLGIDTGGTYTDVVVVDMNSGSVLEQAKALTTTRDLCRGIRAALEQLSNTVVPHVSLVAASTTLATNAVVEGRGRAAGLILLGYDVAHDVDRRLLLDHNLLVPDGTLPPWVFRVSGRCGVNGEELEPLDEDGVRRAAQALQGQVDAVAVSGNWSARDPSHEMRARKLVRSEVDVPVVCAHEVSRAAGIYRRAVTAYLNGRLIPLITGLIESLTQVLGESGVRAPLMMVRSDGSFMSAEMARERPVETILSGPAASAVGGRYLAQCDDAVVVDVGGTTTDIVLLRAGKPRLRHRGITIGTWPTGVTAVETHTTGIGGDSYIRARSSRHLDIGPRRVVPLCLAASEFPAVQQELEYAARCPEDFSLVQHADVLIGRRQETHIRLSRQEALILERLARGPQCVLRLSRALDLHHPRLLNTERLEDVGLVERSALTPTDVIHAQGKLRRWDADVAKQACTLFGRALGLEVSELWRKIWEKLTWMFTDQILRGTLQDTLGPEVQPDGPFWDYCLRRTMGLGGPSPDTIDCRLRVCCPVVAIGAPAGTYLPRVGDVLGTEVLLPSHAAVAGAVGAIVSGVVERCEILIKPVAATHYLVVLPDKKEILEDLEAAVELAVTEGRRVAAARARRAGAYQVHLEVSRRDRRAAAAYNEEQDVYLETVITVTATGRPTPRSETDSC